MGGRYVLRTILSKPIIERIDECIEILTNGKDESLRVEALWVIADTFSEISANDPLRKKIADSLEYVLQHDDNGVVKHEACYVIGENNLRDKIPALRHVIIHDSSDLVRHEAIEALGLLQEFDSRPLLQEALHDPSPAVHQTAAIVLKQLERAENSQATLL